MLKTEMRNPATRHIDTATTKEMLELIQTENINAVNAVGDVLDDIAKACDAISIGIDKGGRLIYMGAGTSGRLGVMDAAECPPTFGISRDLVSGIIAGGNDCMFRAAESEEDKAEFGVADIKKYNITSNDTVVGISAAGGAAYVVGAIEYANEIGATTVGITSNEGTLLSKVAKFPIVTDTGAEVITGSTRMKAGTAQKLVLNMLSTVSMIKMGNVYENLMINLKPSNIKLTHRMVTIVMDILNVSEEEAEKLLNGNDWNIRKTVKTYKSEQNQ